MNNLPPVSSGNIGAFDPEPQMAFRLLCAARRACGKAEKLEDYSGTGITIHAPMEIAEWLMPFGGSVEADIEKIASQIASDDENELVLAVLTAVKDKLCPLEAIGKLLNPEQIEQ